MLLQSETEPFDLAKVFRLMRREMLAALETGGLLKHSVTVGNASEQRWLELFARFLPGQFRAKPAFVVDADGHRSRQVDIVIFDALQTTPMFPHDMGIHVPIESVYAVFEIKSTVDPARVEEACRQAASVRQLSSASGKAETLIAGIVGARSCWGNAGFEDSLKKALGASAKLGKLDLGCILSQGAFDRTPKAIKMSSAEESLAFFMVRLIQRLQALPKARPVDLNRYSRNIESLQED